MCTPGYGITLDRFMRVAHLLPRQRGSVAVDRMKLYRKAATRHDRLDETFLANLQLILIAIYLKKTQPKTQLVQTHANTNTSTPALRQSSGYDWQI